MTIRTKALLLAVTIAGALVLPALAQSKPNVSGTWKMNRAKSKFAEGGGPDAITIKFEQQEGSIHEWLTIGGQQGERTIELTYKTDGIQTTAQVEGREMKTMAKWEGESLLIVFSDSDGGNFSRKFTITDGGKSMAIAVHHSGRGEEKDDTVVLEKQ